MVCPRVLGDLLVTPMVGGGLGRPLGLPRIATGMAARANCWETPLGTPLAPPLNAPLGGPLLPTFCDGGVLVRGLPVSGGVGVVNFFIRLANMTPKPTGLKWDLTTFHFLEVDRLCSPPPPPRLLATESNSLPPLAPPSLSRFCCSLITLFFPSTIAFSNRLILLSMGLIIGLSIANVSFTLFKSTRHCCTNSWPSTARPNDCMQMPHVPFMFSVSGWVGPSVEE